MVYFLHKWNVADLKNKPNRSIVIHSMRKAIGVETEQRTHVIELGAIQKFREAVGHVDTNISDGRTSVVIPPTFLRALSPGSPVVKFESPYPDMLDGGSSWEFFHEISIGEKVVVSEKLIEVEERTGRLGDMLIVKMETSYRKTNGIQLATQINTLIHYDACGETM